MANSPTWTQAIPASAMAVSGGDKECHLGERRSRFRGKGWNDDYLAQKQDQEHQD